MLPFFLNFQSSTGAPIKFYLRSVAQFGKGAFIALTPARWVNLVPSALSPYFLLLKGNTNILCKATEIFQLKTDQQLTHEKDNLKNLGNFKSISALFCHGVRNVMSL